MLALAGGAANPFIVVFLVHVALAALVLKLPIAWGLVVLTVGAFALLFRAPPGPSPLFALGARASPHVTGMWLIAPCCWTQTLDVHESDLAQALRDEIVQRLARRENAVAIEDDLVARFGEPLRAVPRGRDPRRVIPIVIGSAMVFVGLALVRLLRRWIARPRVAPVVASTARDSYDDRIDAAIAQLQDAP